MDVTTDSTYIHSFYINLNQTFDDSLFLVYCSPPKWHQMTNLTLFIIHLNKELGATVTVRFFC